MSQSNPRATAAVLLQRVIYDGKSLSQLLSDNDDAVAPLVKELCFGTLRWNERFSAILDLLLTKPLKAKDKDIECLLRVGLYQILYQNTPEYAAVNETVAAVKGLRKAWAVKFVNGVLRTFLRQKESILRTVDDVETARYCFPEWLVDAVKQAWPEHWESVLTQSNQRAPMTLRVNLSQNTREEYQARLKAEGIDSTPHPVVESAVILDQPTSVFELPGFNEGVVSVQDAAAQLAAPLMQCESGMRVLDACAAPGGKTGHILERTHDLDMVAIDNTETRLMRIGENLERLGLEARIVLADANEPAEWAEPKFDRILLDAPCSATGVIRRHPDIKVLRREDDIQQLQAQQRAILSTMWGLLKEGGRLVYATCSMLPAENETIVAEFLASTPDAIISPIIAEWGLAQRYGRQVLPGMDAMDGFYYAVIEKK
ncbi:MAG: 16S rRNA (cytosine(967)-C(5))-methyltransferase [Proteobacteria bacterium]|nr:MAG: 16S rRNA (cytosine(967)-C(5))-methyltransferase [Pseudomonadota bacterium]